MEPNYDSMIPYTVILKRNDLREELLTEEKRKELVNLLESGVFKILLGKETRLNPNILLPLYVLEIKHSQKPNEPAKLKARFVLEGQRDRNCIVHDKRTTGPEPVRMLIAVATIFEMGVSVADWRQ